MILLPLWWHKFFQTRVDQITQQLKSGISVIEDGGDPALGSESPDRESPGCQIDSEVELRVTILFFLLFFLFLVILMNNFCMFF